MAKTINDLDKRIQIDLSNFSVNGHTHDYTTYIGDHAETAGTDAANSPYTGMAKATTRGMYLTGTYNDAATPVTYGNIINLAGRGTGQILCEWLSGTTSATGKIFYRSHRDTTDAPWGPWKQIAFTDSNISGSAANAATADKLTTARTLIIGNTGKTFDGSGNQSWTLSEIGAFPAAGGNLTGNLNLSTNNSSISGVCGGGTDKWSILGGGADDNGYLEIQTRDNGNEPIYVRQYNANGLVRTATLLDGSGNTSFPGTISEGGTALSSKYAASNHGTHVTYSTSAPKANGTAAVGSASNVSRGDHVHPLQESVAKLTTARTITIGNKSNTFNGSANISYTLSDIGAVAKTGDTMSGTLEVKHGTANKEAMIKATRSDTGISTWLGVGSGGANHGVYSDKLNKWMVYSDGSNVYLNGGAEKLTTTRTINGTNFNGTSNITTANWGTARTITIGKTGKSVNGSGNVSWNMNEIMGAVSLSSSGTANKNKYIKFATVTLTNNWQCCSGKLVLTNTEATASYGILHFYLRNGSAITTTTIELGWLTLNNSNYANRVYAVKVSDGKFDLYYRPYIDYETTRFTLLECNDPGLITLSAGSYTDSITAAATSSMKGISASALKLTTARAIKIGNKSLDFDGSAAITYTLSDIGAAASSHTHSYLPLSGGTMTGKITTPNNAQGITIGDDATICDRNIANHIVIEGATATSGGITFGSGKDTNIYRGGANLLKTDDTFNAVGGFQWNGTSLDSRYSAASHTHNAIVSRGNVTCESGVTARPAVAGLSMSQAYNNGYPTPYGNVINLRGMGDGQILVGWSGTDGAHAPVYVRSKRDNTSTANWSGWAQIYTTVHKPTPADLGLQREYKSAVVDIYSSGISTGGSTLAADTYASHGKSYSFASTTTATVIYKAAFPELKYGKYAICVRMMSSNNTNTSNIAKIEILQGTTVKKTVNLTGKNFTSTSNYSYIYTDFEYTGNASAKQALSIQVSSLTVSGITLKFDYASIEMMNPAVFL